jgi:hypothetical protein
VSDRLFVGPRTMEPTRGELTSRHRAPPRSARSTPFHRLPGASMDPRDDYADGVRVRCVSTDYAYGAIKNGNASGWLTIGREYTVFSLSTHPKYGVFMRIAADEGDLGVWPAQIFEVTDAHLSERWRCAIEPDGRLELAPEPWLGMDWDNDPRAFALAPDEVVDAVVAGEVAALLAEHDDPGPLGRSS